MEQIILSIKPCFSNQIYKGTKSIELRKKIGTKFKPGMKVYIYSTYPEKKISGHAYIKQIQVLPIWEIRENFLQNACISREEFDRYYIGHKEGVLIWIYNVTKYQSGISLTQLRTKGFTAPQSFCYVTESIKSVLEDLE